MSGSVFIFAGPTLRAEDRAAHAEFTYLPPAAQGDVFRAGRRKPRAMGLIDGYFDGVPAVWHKEILWAMAQGIHVFGAASMGALRAAELHGYGMRGCGWIFEAFRDGLLTDDDEVAVRHGPAEMDYAAVTLPMVNVRATCAAARSAGALSETICASLLALAKAEFYQVRTWRSVLAAVERVLPAAELAQLRDWLDSGRVDQKRADALLMLQDMRRFLAGDPGYMRVDYALEHTQMWTNASWRTDEDDPGAKHAADRGVLDELRLEPETYRRLRREALTRHLAFAERPPSPVQPAAAEVRARITRFCRTRGLFRGADRQRWLADNSLSEQAFESLMADETAVENLAEDLDTDLGAAILDCLRLQDGFAALALRAASKARFLAEQNVHAMAEQQAGIRAVLLRAWYFEQHLRDRIPDDIERYARTLGLEGAPGLHRLLFYEYLFVNAGRSTGEQSPG